MIIFILTMTNNIPNETTKSKPPMMLISPPITIKYFPKLHQCRGHHYRLPCPLSHFHPKQMQIPLAKTYIITTHNHSERHTPINTESENGGGRTTTTMSDTVVNYPRREVNWNEFDVATSVAVVGLHFLCLFAPFAFNWRAVQVAIGLELVIRLFGINISYHRHLSHKSFKVPKWLEYTFAYCGVQSLQGNPIDWVRTHRFHHQYVDTEKDPHSPIKGFWFSHVLWMFDTNNTTSMARERNNVRDLEKQLFYRFIRRTYLLHPIALALVLYALGGHPFVVWGMGVRTVLGYHITWLVNSTCHGRGDQTWNTRDLSLNSRWMGILAFGDGWHHNHHAFKYSARHGLEWWQVDITWYLIRLLEIIGLASDVKLPTPADIQRKTFPLKASSP